MNDTWIIRDDFQRGHCAKAVASLDVSEQPHMVTIKPWSRHRTNDQNSFINTMYRDIAKQLDGEGIVDVRRRCKLHYGVPILRANDEKFRGIYDKVVRPHIYEDKILIMDFLPVTSLMNTAQASEYIETVIREYAGHGVSLKGFSYE